MNAEQAFNEILRQAPCPHETTSDNGKEWAKCHDCGATIRKDCMAKAIGAAQRFHDAVEHLRSLLYKSL